MRRCHHLLLAGLVSGLLLDAGLTAQTPSTAVGVTARGRAMERALDSVLGGQGSGSAEERTLFLLIDPTPSLKTAGFVDKFAAALERNKKRMTKTLIGVGRVGLKGTVVLPPTKDHKAVLAKIRKELAKTTDGFQNVYADVRTAAETMANQPGRRELTLITLENGDAEDQIEATVIALKRNQVTFKAICGESYLADSYWAARPYEKAPRKTKLTGGDAALIDLPWGWMWQITIANEVSPSGYAVWGISRLAAGTKGRVHLYSPPPSTGHRCSIYGICMFCSNDHATPRDTYWAARTTRYAPFVSARNNVFKRMAKDPFFRATVKAWETAHKARLVRGGPSAKITGASLKPQRPRNNGWIDLTSGMAFARHAKRADKAAGDCGRILASLQRAIKSQQGNGIPRQKAVAELTAINLQITKVNMITFAGWCREVAPALWAKKMPSYEPPELSPLYREDRPYGIGYTNMSLCHGVRPFYELELPGGEKLRKEMQVLEKMVDDFDRLYSHTPFSVALHRSGIARFHFTYRGIAGRVKRKRPKSSEQDDPVTRRGRGRPPRTGGSSGGTAGPTTGR